MGEKGMESPAPSRSGVAGAETVAGRMAGVSDMAAAGSFGTVTGGMDQGMGAGMGETLSTPIQQARGTIGPPPKG